MSDILKTQITDTRKDGKKEESTKSNKDKSDKKSESWFSSQHAWKLGLLSMGISIILAGGNMLFIWGK